MSVQKQKQNIIGSGRSFMGFVYVKKEYAKVLLDTLPVLHNPFALDEIL